MADCPICCEPFDESDMLFELRCPTEACDFNMCSRCIEDFQKSVADDYQMASDGSKQVKVQLKCPQCRAKYECQKYPSSTIVDAVLLLRLAHRLEDTAQEADSNLTAKLLSLKHDFKQAYSIEQLEDAQRRLSTYLRDIGKDEGFPSLQIGLWSGFLPEVASSSSSSPRAKRFFDPTLLSGLEEFMSTDEQEFVCERLTSGTTEGLVQGAQTLQSMLELVALGKVTIHSEPDPDTHNLRKKYKLPNRMPRYVHLPHFDPESGGKGLKFQGKNSLVISHVRGPAGRLGIRTNDIVTHFQGEKVGDLDMFTRRMRTAYLEFPEGTSPLTVNADMETAVALQKRAKEVLKSRKQKRGG